VSSELRAPTLDDLPALTEFFDELESRYGDLNLSASKVRDDLTRRNENVAQNYRIAVEGSRVSGWATLWSPEGQPERIFLSPLALPRERERYARLLDWAEDRAREIADGKDTRLQATAEHDDEELAGELRARGYEPVRHFFEMEIDLTNEPPEPQWPEGLSTRPFELADARGVYEADLEAFEDHWDFFPVTFEEWSEYFFGSSDFDQGLWSVVEDAGALAGFAMCSKRGGTALGHVHVLGVRRPWRRRGLGTALLLESFRKLRDNGCERAMLMVDGENLTGAVQLYERAGMQVARRAGRYWKELPEPHAREAT
jgi:mycothiol synthase